MKLQATKQNIKIVMIFPKTVFPNLMLANSKVTNEKTLRLKIPLDIYITHIKTFAKKKKSLYYST